MNIIIRNKSVLNNCNVRIIAKKHAISLILLNGVGCCDPPKFSVGIENGKRFRGIAQRRANGSQLCAGSP